MSTRLDQGITPALMETIPNDMLNTIIGHLNSFQVTAVQRVCKQWFLVSQKYKIPTIVKAIFFLREKYQEKVPEFYGDPKEITSNTKITNRIVNYTTRKIEQVLLTKSTRNGEINGNFITIDGFTIDGMTGCLYPAYYDYNIIAFEKNFWFKNSINLAIVTGDYINEYRLYQPDYAIPDEWQLSDGAFYYDRIALKEKSNDSIMEGLFYLDVCPTLIKWQSISFKDFLDDPEAKNVREKPYFLDNLTLNELYEEYRCLTIEEFFDAYEKSIFKITYDVNGIIRNIFVLCHINTLIEENNRLRLSTQSHYLEDNFLRSPASEILVEIDNVIFLKQTI